MKLIINLTLSLILVFLSAFVAANTCCCANSLMQKVSQDQTDLTQNNCHDEAQKSDLHNYGKCQCDHQAASSLPSIVASTTVSQVEASAVLAKINPSLFSYHFDNIYRPPISA